MKESYKLLYRHRSTCRLSDVRRIIEAAIFAADAVLLPAELHIDIQASNEERKFILTRLDEMHELGAIQLWEVEAPGGREVERKRGAIWQGAADRVIPRDDYIRMLGEVDDRVMEQREFFLKGEGKSFDGITEIVLGRHAMWRFAIAETLGANRLLVDSTEQRDFEYYFSDLFRYEDFESKVIGEIAHKLQLPDVSTLSTEEIERCRKLMPAFRDRLLRETRDKYDSLLLPDLVARIGETIVHEFHDVLLRRDLKHVRVLGKQVVLPSSMGREAYWDLLQLILQPVVLTKYLHLFFQWRRDATNVPPLLLLLQLQSIGAAERERTHR